MHRQRCIKQHEEENDLRIPICEGEFTYSNTFPLLRRGCLYSSTFSAMAAQDIEFRTSDNVTLRGWLIRPKGIAVDQKLPCLIMSSGFTATIEIELKTFAEKLIARAPISCLVYDHRGFGYSDAKEGQPRQEVIPSQQISDMSDAITYAQSRLDVNADRIGLWGTSYSGGHVLHVGAFDRRAKIILSQVPCTDGWANMHRLVGPDQWAEVNKSWQEGMCVQLCPDVC